MRYSLADTLLDGITRAGATRVTVLHSLAAPDGTTKYVNQIVEGAPESLGVRFFSWRAALRADYDVLHVHWPELLLRGRTRRIRAMKRMAMRLLLLRVRARGIPLVRTVHNAQPHERGNRAEHRLLERIDRTTDLFIRLNPTTAPLGSAPVATILHGHYRDRFAAHPKSSSVPGRVLYFGLIRPYKGVDRLIDLAPRLASAGVSVRIVGSPSDDMRALVEAADAREPNISTVLAFVPDHELVREVTAAELVVLPYREMHNSGAVLVALSLDRPVLVPRSPSNSALSSEVGPGWVTEYDGELDEQIIAGALARVRSGVDGRPHLDGRDWSTVGELHLQAYSDVLARRGAV